MWMTVPYPNLRQLFGEVVKLGCGSEGCAFKTGRDTVVKLSESSGALINDRKTAAALQPLFGKHPIVPRIYGSGELRVPLSTYVWVEREPLNDVVLSDEGEAQFSDDIGRVLGNVYQAKVPTKFPSYVPKRDQKILLQMARGHIWLREQGFELDDHNGSENWGLRADGSVALRDLGRIYLHQRAES